MSETKPRFEGTLLPEYVAVVEDRAERRERNER